MLDAHATAMAQHTGLTVRSLSRDRRAITAATGR